MHNCGFTNKRHTFTFFLSSKYIKYDTDIDVVNARRMNFFLTEWCTNSQITLLIYLLLLRNCAEWLEENFFRNNGLPDFFIEGKYSYQNKAVAIQEYRETVNLAVNSENISFSRWSKMIVNTNFSVSFLTICCIS